MQQTTAVMVSGTFPLLLLAKHSHTYTTVYRLSAAQMAFKALFFTLFCLTLLRHSNSFASGVHCSSSTGTNHQKGTRLKDWKLKISDLDEGWDQEDLEKEVTELTVQMMKIDSTTGHEGRVVWFLKEYLEERGWDVLLQEVGGDLCRDEGAPPRANLLATRPGEGPPRLLFNTHTDTVPPYLPPRVEGGTIWGRGACDAKGIAAAQVAAAARLARRGVAGVGLLLVAGEEVDHAGARAAAALGLAPAYVVIGEPTEGRQVRLQKGLLKLRLTTAGKACHSGYPEEGHSAIDDLVELLHELKHEAWPSDPALGATTLNIGLLRGGQAANALAERAEATLMFRAVGQPAKLRARVERAVANAAIGAAPGRGPARRGAGRSASRVRPGRFPAVPGGHAGGGDRELARAAAPVRLAGRPERGDRCVQHGRRLSGPGRPLQAGLGWSREHSTRALPN
mmetsp:Transcript_3952/g.6416  ORF Transcript_3952/g.6416 Transcript_3952/m.6416 type:complete len:452 (+) Transcript_3952:36-1391(+)